MHLKLFCPSAVFFYWDKNLFDSHYDSWFKCAWVRWKSTRKQDFFSLLLFFSCYLKSDQNSVPHFYIWLLIPGPCLSILIFSVISNYKQKTKTTKIIRQNITQHVPVGEILQPNTYLRLRCWWSTSTQHLPQTNTLLVKCFNPTRTSD